MIKTLTVCAVLAAAGSAWAQTCVLVVDGTGVGIYQNGALLSSWDSMGTYPLVVRKNIEAAPIGGGTGTIWDLNGNVLGNFVAASNGGHFDAATDGKSIYITQNFCGVGEMWRLDTNWQNPELMYNWSADGGCGIGVTFDTKSGTLWTSSYGPNIIAQLDSDGKIISQFDVPFGEPSGLAYEPETDTLWMPRSGTDELWQFDKNTGKVLQTLHTGVNLGDSYSAEFQIPAPGAAGLLALAGLAAARRRR